MLRPQYHFRPSAQGLLAWNVRRLIALSRDFPVRSIKIGEIAELNENHWYAQGSAAPTCKSIAEHCALINEADLSYPIILDSAGRVMDGMHRVCKALIQGMETLPAVQFVRDPEPDYVGKRPDELPYDDG
jgi:hypothetical protein